jgi:PEP-CTERM motif-containing protein
VPKCSHIFWSVAILFSLLLTVSGQGFGNLNFEQARIVSALPGYTPSDAYNPISAARALPYWTVTEDGTACTAVWGMPEALDETSVALVSAAYTPIQGSYSVQLSAYADAPSDLFHSSSISQTGHIPFGSQSIRFSIASPFQAGSVPPNPRVTLNGTQISLSPVSQSGDVTTMAGNIGAFAGTTATLAFFCEATQSSVFPANENIFNLDDIRFSPQAVPEPATLAFVLLGVASLFVSYRGKKLPHPEH